MAELVARFHALSFAAVPPAASRLALRTELVRGAWVVAMIVGQTAATARR
ncbi:MAG TPA: hypothetical protein VJQ09_03080 [Candidatus Limnocylindria bacterium]|nr:hypothetical protein [Candidatus Limnocylindria bacterium]